MAQENILSISLKEYKQEIDEIKASMLGLEQQSDEYKAKANEVREMQDKLNQVLSDCKSTTSAAEGSYNALTRQMSELKKAWKATNDESVRQNLGNQIKSLNDQLKGMDASIGNYQRNVGNYKNSFLEAGKVMKEFGGTAGGVASSVMGMIPAVQGANKALLELCANPIGAVIAAIGLVIMACYAAFEALKSGVTSSQENMNKWKQVVAPLNGIVTTFTKALQFLAGTVLDGLIAVVNTITAAFESFINMLANAAEFVGLDGLANDLRSINEEIEFSVELEQKKQDLEKANIDLIYQEADANLKVDELRAKANDREQYNLKQRRKFAEDAYKAERAILQAKVENAQAAYDLVKIENERAGSTREALNNEARAYQALQDAKGALARLDREYHSQQRSFAKEEERNNNKAAAAAARANRTREQADKKREQAQKEESDRTKKILELEKAITDEKNKQAIKGSELDYRNQVVAARLAHEIAMEGIQKQFAKSSDLSKALDLEQKRYEQQLHTLRMTHLNEQAALEITNAKNNAERIYGIAASTIEKEQKVASGAVVTFDFEAEKQRVKDYYDTVQSGYVNAYSKTQKILEDYERAGAEIINNSIEKIDELPEAAKMAIEKVKAYDIIQSIINNKDVSNKTKAIFQDLSIELIGAVEDTDIKAVVDKIMAKAKVESQRLNGLNLVSKIIDSENFEDSTKNIFQTFATRLKNAVSDSDIQSALSSIYAKIGTLPESLKNEIKEMQATIQEEVKYSPSLILSLFGDIESIPEEFKSVFKTIGIDIEAFQKSMPKDMFEGLADDSAQLDNLRTHILAVVAELAGLKEEMTSVSETSKEAQITIDLNAIEQQFSAIPRTALDNAKIAMAQSKVILDNMYKKFEESDAEYRARQLAAEQDYFEKKREFANEYFNDYVKMSTSPQADDNEANEDLKNVTKRLRDLESSFEETKKNYEKIREGLKNELNSGLISQENYLKRMAELHALELADAKKYNEDIESAYQEYYDARIEYDKNLDKLVSKRDVLEENTALTQAQKRLEALEYEQVATEVMYKQGLLTDKEYWDKKVELQKNYVNETQKRNEQIVNFYTAMANGIASTLGTVASIMEANIKQRQKDGKISEKQAEAEFERVKKLQISEAVINTLTGSVGGYLQAVKTYPAPYGPILGALTAASALATGIAQIQKIKQTSFGSSNVSSSNIGGTASVVVDPILNETLDSNSLQSIELQNNMESEESDQKVYILQSEIDESQKQVKVRENETTF